MSAIASTETASRQTVENAILAFQNSEEYREASPLERRGLNWQIKQARNALNEGRFKEALCMLECASYH